MAPLPLPQTSFIGRGRELAVLQRLLADARLITLTGAPGTGKTRLALELAASAAHRFPDGVCFVSLAAVRDPTVVLGTLARALGVRELPGRPLAAGVRDYLAGKRLLLVLDNFEQVLAAATLVTGLLAACPHLTMLVTSRIVLHVQGEQTFAVPPLTLPNRWRNAPTEPILQAEAVQLFVARARPAQAGTTPTRDDGAVLAELCCRLDGLPLAIELAAARTRLLPPSLLLAHMEQHRTLLGEDAGNLPARQQTLRTAITWSYNLLDDQERALFRRLAVFSGGFTLEAVEGICTDDAIAADEVMHLVHRLLDHSLVLTEESHGAVRCRLLETLREFAQEQW